MGWKERARLSNGRSKNGRKSTREIMVNLQKFSKFLRIFCKFRYNPEDHPLDDKEKTKINVPARNHTKVLISAWKSPFFLIQVKLSAKKGQQFKWLWRVSSGDVDFCIMYQEKVVRQTNFQMIKFQKIIIRSIRNCES